VTVIPAIAARWINTPIKESSVYIKIIWERCVDLS
jgi:hypothetical protein